GEVLGSKEALARAENALKLLILGDADRELWSASLTPVEDKDVPAATTIELDAWMEKAVVARPEVKEAEAALGRRHLEASLAKDQTRPSLQAVASYDRLGLAGTRNPAVAPAPGSVLEDLGTLEGGLGRSIATLHDGSFSDA